jgi:hypothetical protein
MVPLRLHRFRLNCVDHEGARWLAETLHREGRRLGTEVVLDEDGTLILRWAS